MANIKYSIAIPVHNNDDTFMKCLLSVLNQTFENYEIVISDTSFTDNIQKKVNSIMCDKIRYFRNNERWTMWDNHNYLINNSFGEYIFFLHADDYMLPNSIEILDDCLKKLNYPQRVILSGGSVYADFKILLKKLGLECDKWIMGSEAVNLFSLGGLTPSGTIFSIDIKQFGGFVYDGMIIPYSDCWTELKLCLNGFRYLYINDILYLRSSNGTTFKYGNRKEIKEVYLSLKSVFSKEQLDIIKNAALNNLSFELLKFFVQDLEYRSNIRWILFKVFIRHPYRYKDALNLLLKF